MNPDIPNNVRKALVNQPAGEVHPAADLLNAYAERGLPTAEDDHIAGHLAACAECRTVMFLAQTAAEQPVEIPATSPSASKTWWRWAMPAAAALSIAVALVTVKQADLRHQSPPARQAAMVLEQSPSVGKDTPDSSKTPDSINPSSAAGETVTRKSTKINRALRRPDGMPFAKNMVQAKSLASPAPSGMNAAPVPARDLSGALASNVQAALPNLQTANVHNGPLQQTAQNQSANNTLGITEAAESVEVPSRKDRGAAAPSPSAAPQLKFRNEHLGAMALADSEMTAKRSTLSRMASQIWRISSDGHVERMMQNQWHRALNGVQKSFRVVAYVQDHVWAGGSGPELFHSADGGDNWNTIKVKTADGEFNGTMQTIRASDAQHLAIIADDGSTWTTTDGGQTWAKQQ